MFWNVRSLYNKIDTIKEEINKLAPDILNISETWLHNQTPDHFVHISNYSLIRNDRSLILHDGSTKRGGGICTYIRQGLNFVTIPESSICTLDVEMSVIEYCLPHTRKIYILNVYRPPSGDVDNCIKHIQDCINKLRISGKIEFFIGGDSNIDVRSKNTNSSKKLLRFFKINQFKKYIVQSSRPDSNATLDLIISNCEIVKETGSYDINVSDHLPVYVIRKKSKIIREQTTFRGRSYNKNLVENELKDLFLEYDWIHFGENYIDNCWKIMYSRIVDVVNKLCPMKEFKFAKEKPKWMSDDLIELMKNRDISLKQYLKTKTEGNKKEMRRMRNMVNVAIRNARIEYVKGQLEIHQKNPKKIWKQITDILPSKTDNQNFDNIKNDNNETIPKEELSNYINTFFATIGRKLDANFRNVPIITMGSRNSLHTHDDIQNGPNNFKLITMQQLEKEITNISVHKSSGIQHLSAYVLKLCFNILKEKLLVVINKSLFQGYFPKMWRHATIIPIPKVTIPKEVGDLRPIALTPLPGKMLERFVHIQLMEHLDTHKLLNNIQNGFRKNHSTIDTIFKFTSSLQSYKNQRYNTIALYIDFKKAFDTVNHKILIEKLKSLKITGNVLNWLETYLTNRNQNTQLFDQLSLEENVSTGVPQGSILGPTLFLCYINDICTVCKSSEMLLYADDTVLYKKISDFWTCIILNKMCCACMIGVRKID